MCIERMSGRARGRKTCATFDGLALFRFAGPEMRASPLARRMATDLGVDLARLAVEQLGHRIERADVEEAARAIASPRTGVQLDTPPAPTIAQTAPLSGVRRITAARMAESAHTAAPVTLTTDADATELARLREQIGADLAGTHIRPPSYNSF